MAIFFDAGDEFTLPRAASDEGMSTAGPSLLAAAPGPHSSVSHGAFFGFLTLRAPAARVVADLEESEIFSTGRDDEGCGSMVVVGEKLINLLKSAAMAASSRA